MNSILIIGGGSMGQRHLRNLLTLGFEEKNVSLVETDSKRADVIKKELAISVLPSVAAAFKQKKYTIAIICSPPVYHLEHMLLCARQACDIFVEKPLAHTLIGLKKVVELIKRKKLITMVGSNWKFHPSFQKMKQLLDRGAIGKVYSARAYTGKYLPDWHPAEDYRRGYSAQKKLGGGVLLDYHECDYLTWLAGPAAAVACLATQASDLEMDAEDVAEIIVKFKSGGLGEIHIDYLERFGKREYQFIGALGTISWSLAAGAVTLETAGNKPQVFPLESGYDTNDMYVAELKHWLECCRRREAAISPADDLSVMRLIAAAERSAAEKITVVL